MKETPLYGPHKLKGKDYPANFPVLDGPIESTCELCGAWSPNIGDPPLAGHNPQEDPFLCGMNPLNDAAKEIVAGIQEKQ